MGFVVLFCFLCSNHKLTKSSVKQDICFKLQKSEAENCDKADEKFRGEEGKVGLFSVRLFSAPLSALASHSLVKGAVLRLSSPF